MSLLPDADKLFLQGLMKNEDWGKKQLGERFVLITETATPDIEASTKLTPYSLVAVGDKNTGDKAIFTSVRHGVLNTNPELQQQLEQKVQELESDLNERIEDPANFTNYVFSAHPAENMLRWVENQYEQE